MTEEMGLQTFPENRYWRRRRDVQRHSVPQSGSSDRKSSIADGWNTGASDNKRLCRCRAETLTVPQPIYGRPSVNGNVTAGYWRRFVYRPQQSQSNTGSSSEGMTTVP